VVPGESGGTPPFPGELVEGKPLVYSPSGGSGGV
jgi:hypothetical protein